MINIVRYPNRKLYDKNKSDYITLDDIRDYVLKKQEFIVINHLNKADITELTILKTMVHILGKKQGNKDIYKEIIRKDVC